MSDGRSSERAASMAFEICSMSLPFWTRIVCQPYASKRSRTSSVNAQAVGPSSWIWLSSYSAMSLPSRRCPASELASDATPSWRSPSEQMTYVWWSMSLWPGLLNSPARRRSAIAMPTAFVRPWPSGPVVASTPGVSPYSGWPGVIEPHWRNAFTSSSVTAYPVRWSIE